MNGTIAGRVVDSVSGQPIPYALISFGGKRWFSTETGHFDLTGVTPGLAVLTVTQIAYAPAETRIDVGPEQATELPSDVTLRLSRRALVLPELTVRGRAGCSQGSRADQAGRAAEPIVDAALENAERLLVLERTYPFRSTFLYNAASYDAHDERTESRVSTVVTATATQKGYAPGRVVDKNGVINYFTTSDLARPSFAEGHCFWPAGTDSLDGAALLVVEFAPSGDLTEPDWAGRLTLDSHTGQLRQSLAHLVQVDSARHKVVSAQCIVIYGLVVAMIVHEAKADCVSIGTDRNRRTTLANWRFLNLHFDKRKPGAPP